MPNGASVYDRYMWYLRLLTYNGFAVLVDNHLNSDPTITLDVNLWTSVCSALVHLIELPLDTKIKKRSKIQKNKSEPFTKFINHRNHVPAMGAVGMSNNGPLSMCVLEFHGAEFAGGVQD